MLVGDHRTLGKTAHFRRARRAARTKGKKKKKKKKKKTFLFRLFDDESICRWQQLKKESWASLHVWEKLLQNARPEKPMR
jgi:hypothetical protein